MQAANENATSISRPALLFRETIKQLSSKEQSMANLSVQPVYLYKILSSTSVLPDPVTSSSILPKTPLDDDDGFIHLSTGSQVAFVLRRFFTSTEDRSVFLVRIVYKKLADGGDVRWEEVGGNGSSFAHLYGGDITGEAVDGVQRVEREADGDWDPPLRRLSGTGWLEGGSEH